ncbi:MAG: RraA family protein [Candidatus Micrarchaeaceae archaeon]
MNFKIVEDFVRVDTETISKFEKIHPSTYGHLTDKGIIKSLRPIVTPIRLVGSALTVRIPHVDSTAVHVVLEYAKPGDVVVVNTSGDFDRACWGGLVTYAAVKKGINGALIDGMICDLEEIKELGFKIFSRGVGALTTRILGIEGEIGTDIAIDGTVIHSGDLIWADEDGIVVLAKEDIDDIYEKIKATEENEINIKKRIDRGESLAVISGAHKMFHKLNNGVK